MQHTPMQISVTILYFCTQNTLSPCWWRQH